MKYPVRNQPSLILQLYKREAGGSRRKESNQSNPKSQKQQMICQEERKQSSFSLLTKDWQFIVNFEIDKQENYTLLCVFWASKPDSGLGGPLSYCLLKSKTSGGKQREELLGLRLETVHTDSLTGHSWELIGPLWAAGSPQVPTHSSLLQLAEMSHNSLCEQVGLMEPTEVSLPRKPCKGTQELLTDGKSQKLMKMSQ